MIGSCFHRRYIAHVGIATVSIFLLSTSLAGAGNSITFQDLHNNESYLDIRLSAVSRNNMVTSGHIETDTGNAHAYRWSATTGRQNIHNDTLFSDSYVEAISNNGNVLIGYAVSRGSNEDYAYRWTQATGMQSLHNDTLFSYSYANGLSSNGDVVIGVAADRVSNEEHAYRWTQATGMRDIHDNPDFTYSDAQAVSGNGDVIAGVGYHLASGNEHVFRWTDVTGMQDIHNDTLFTYSTVNGMSADGAVIAGYARNRITGQEHAFRWTETIGMEDIHDASLFEYSVARYISLNGDVIVGPGSSLAGNGHVFRWTEAGGMQDIHNDTLYVDSTVRGMSLDGSMIVGTGENRGTGFSHAYLWTEANGMRDIHDENVFESSTARVISANGNVVLGFGYDVVNTGHPVSMFRWTEAKGMQDIYQILVDANINMTGWDALDNWGQRIGVSADGTQITGVGVYNGNTRAWLFVDPSLNDGTGGLIDMDELAHSFAQSATSASQAQSAMTNSFSQSMVVARNALSGYFGNRVSSGNKTPTALASIQPAAGSAMKPAYRKALYATGSLGLGQNDDFSNYGTNGTMGVLAEVNANTAIGMGVVAGYSDIDTYRGGSNRTTSKGVQFLSTHEGENGLRLYGVATIASLDISNNRHYLNGGGIDSSKGKSDGIGYGVAAKAGYEFAVPHMSSLSFMPYAEIDLSRVNMDAYTETRGGFPAHVKAQNKGYVASRLGGEVSHALRDDLTLRGRMAWGHRYSDGGTAVSTIAGITNSFDVDAGDRNWADVGAGVNWQINDRTTVTTDLAGRIGKTSEPAISAIAAVVWKFD